MNVEKYIGDLIRSFESEARRVLSDYKSKKEEEYYAAYCREQERLFEEQRRKNKKCIVICRTFAEASRCAEKHNKGLHEWSFLSNVCMLRGIDSRYTELVWLESWVKRDDLIHAEFRDLVVQIYR